MIRTGYSLPARENDMIFPRPTVKVGDCIAVLCSKGKRSGTALVHRRQILKREGFMWKAHRLAFHLNKKPIICTPVHGSDQYVLHKCDNFWCVNPEHLYLGTQADNIRDMYERSSTIRQNLSMAAKRQTYSEERRAKISERMSKHLTGQTGERSRRYGKKHTEATKLKISNDKFKNPVRYWLGKPRADETKRKISDSLRAKS